MKQLAAPKAGIIVEIRVKQGDLVQEGTEFAVLESMKMQIPIPATCSGKVTQIHVKKEDFVNEGQPIVTLE